MSNRGKGSRVIDWIDYRLPIFSTLRHTLVDYPTPRNLNYWWNFWILGWNISFNSNYYRNCISYALHSQC